MAKINVHPEIREMKLADIQPAPYNPREITEPAYAGLQESLRKFGMIELLVVNKRSGRLVAGHQRLKILLAAGVAAAPVIIVDLDDATEQAANITLNNQQLAGEWTAALLPIIDRLKAEMPADALALRIDELRAEIAAGSVEQELAAARLRLSEPIGATSTDRTKQGFGSPWASVNPGNSENVRVVIGPLETHLPAQLVADLNAFLIERFDSDKLPIAASLQTVILEGMKNAQPSHRR